MNTEGCRYSEKSGDENTVSISLHAKVRMAQRGVEPCELQYVMDHGQVFYNGGATFVFLGKDDVPKEHKKMDAYAKLVGTVLILASDSPKLITIYKNKEALRQIKRKLKRYVDYRHVA